MKISKLKPETQFDLLKVNKAKPEGIDCVEIADVETGIFLFAQIFGFGKEDRAQRVVTLWNGFRDIPTEAIESGGVQDVVKALKAFMSLGVGQYKTGFTATDKEIDEIFNQGAKALAKLEGRR